MLGILFYDVAFLLTVGRSTITPLSRLLSSFIGPLPLGQGSSLGSRPRAAADQIMLRAEMIVCPKWSLAHDSSKVRTRPVGGKTRCSPQLGTVCGQWGQWGEFWKGDMERWRHDRTIHIHLHLLNSHTLSAVMCHGTLVLQPHLPIGRVLDVPQNTPASCQPHGGNL
jgi:hypothetical protein